jgi:uncharacterized YigZ family protein
MLWPDKKRFPFLPLSQLFQNPMQPFYQTIESSTKAEYKDRGSRFIAYLFPINAPEDFKKHLKAIKDEHPKAVHHCFAYRLGVDGAVFRTNDDGEPAGTAGKPILGQLDSKGVTNAAVVVVRYFGGTLLGVPGLIAAYKTVTALALQLTPVLQKSVFVNYDVLFDYTLLNDVMLLVKRFGCTVQAQELQLFCRMQLGVPLAQESAWLQKANDMRGVEVTKVPLL